MYFNKLYQSNLCCNFFMSTKFIPNNKIYGGYSSNFLILFKRDASAVNDSEFRKKKFSPIRT